MAHSKDIAAELAHAINVLTFSPEEVAKYFARDTHRYLQEEFGQLCLEYLKVAARNDYGYDARNEWFHNKAVEIVAAAHSANIKF